MLIQIPQAEAGDAHSKDLQTLRAESQASIEQLRASHQSTINDLKAEHTSGLDSQTKELEKRLSHQALELKAAHDDLAKAKATVEAARAEIESLRSHRDDAV